METERQIQTQIFVREHKTSISLVQRLCNSHIHFIGRFPFVSWITVSIQENLFTATRVNSQRTNRIDRILWTTFIIQGIDVGIRFQHFCCLTFQIVRQFGNLVFIISQFSWQHQGYIPFRITNQITIQGSFKSSIFYFSNIFHIRRETGS